MAAVAARQAMLAKQRLLKEYKLILSEPIDNCVIKMDEKNIYTWYYCFDGNKTMEGGKYFGKIQFPPEYPHRPPAVFIFTPNGVIQCNESICLSISEYHPETWDPSIGPRVIVLSLFVFFDDCIESKTASAQSEWNGTPQDQMQYARESKQFNLDHDTFCKFFPELVNLWTKNQTEEKKTDEKEIQSEAKVADTPSPETETKPE